VHPVVKGITSKHQEDANAKVSTLLLKIIPLTRLRVALGHKIVTVSEDQVVHSVNPGNQLIFCEMKINKRPVRMQVDFGATACILPKHYLGELPIRPKKVCLQMWNKTSLSALGKCKVNVKNPTTRREYKVDFVIVDKNNTPHLSGVAAQKMNSL